MNPSFQVAIIDDDTVFCDCLKTYLDSLGLNVAVIHDAALATTLDFSNFQIVLLDLEMPHVSGADLIEKIPANERPLVIMVSAHHDIETRLSLLSAGADYFLSKPINLPEVGLIIQRALGRMWSIEQKQHAWTLNKSRFTLTAPCGRSYGLSHSEFTVLEEMFSKAPNPVSLSDIEQSLIDKGATSNANFRRSLEVMLSRMRKRFNTGSLPFPVKSVRNLGYVFHGSAEIED